MAIAFYNLAVEEEFFKRYEASLNYYKKSCTIVEEHFGPEDALVKKF